MPMTGADSESAGLMFGLSIHLTIVFEEDTREIICLE